MSERRYRVLFLCTGNSARSILAECLMNRHGGNRFEASSAGSHPKPAPHPRALELLAEEGYDTAGLRSKSWDELARPGAPELDFVFTVCDQAAGESCPVWPGQPVSAHWGIQDPAAVEGGPGLERAAFRRAYRELEHRIRAFASLPIGSLDRISLTRHLDEIHRKAPSSSD